MTCPRKGAFATVDGRAVSAGGTLEWGTGSVCAQAASGEKRYGNGWREG